MILTPVYKARHLMLINIRMLFVKRQTSFLSPSLSVYLYAKPLHVENAIVEDGACLRASCSTSRLNLLPFSFVLFYFCSACYVRAHHQLWHIRNDDDRSLKTTQSTSCFVSFSPLLTFHRKWQHHRLWAIPEKVKGLAQEDAYTSVACPHPLLPPPSGNATE